MKTNRFARTFVAALIALGAAAATLPTTASARDMYSGGSRQQWSNGHQDGRYSRHRDWDRRYNLCSPYEAVRKARWMGLRHAGVGRVSHRAIVVFGRHRGHPANVVFDRHSPRCRIVAARGIRW